MIGFIRVGLFTCLGIVGITAGIGCDAPIENAGCVASDAEVVELDEDLGGYTVESMARSRSGRGVLTDTEGVEVGFSIETVALGPAVATRGVDCTDRASFETPVEVTLRSDDGRVDIVLDGELTFDVVAGAAFLHVDDLDAVPSCAVLDLPAELGATSTLLGTAFDLQGVDGRGSISWRLTGPSSTMIVGELALPYAISADASGP